MAEMKFSCPECGQHIAYGPGWAGLRIECPTCRAQITVPSSKPIPVAVPRPPAMAEAPSSPAKLASGATDVPRQAAHPPAPQRKRRPLPIRGGNPVLNYAVLLALVAALGGLGYFYGLPLLKSSQEEPSATPTPAASTSQTGARRAGPMGELNDAMDVSESLDGGSSAKPRAVPATNSTARPQSKRSP